MSLFSSLANDDIELPRKEVKEFSFPLDCVGLILLYISDSSVLKNFLLLSFHTKKYIERNYECCQNIRFVFSKSPKTNKSYVLRLYVGDGVKAKNNFSERFPNTRTLHLVKMNKLDNSLFFHIPNLEKLVMEGCPRINKPPFEKMKKLRHLEIDNSKLPHGTYGYYRALLDTSKFIHLQNLESLRLKSVQPSKHFNHEHFSQLRKLTSLSLDRSRLFESSIFQHLSSLEVLAVEYQYCELSGFEHLKDLKSNLKHLTIRKVRGLYNREMILKALGGKKPEIFNFMPAMRKKGEVVKRRN